MNSFYSVLNNWHVKKCVIEACFCTAVYYCAALAILAQPKVSFDNEDYYELSVTGLYNNWTASLVLFTSFYTWASTHTHTHTSMDATGTTRGSACGPRMLQHVDRSSQGIDRPTFQSVDLPVSASMLTFTTTDSEKPIKRRRTVRISPHSPGTAAQQVPHYYSLKPKWTYSNVLYCLTHSQAPQTFNMHPQKYIIFVGA